MTDAAPYEPARSLPARLMRRLARTQNAVLATAAADVALLSITFDDFPRSAAVAGARVLEAAGARGTYFLTGGFLGGRTHLGPIADADDVRRLHADGHEIGCHSFAHPDLRCARPEDASPDLDRNAALFAELGLPAPRVFAYPYGEIAPGLKPLIADRFDIARGVHAGLVRGRFDRAGAPAVALDLTSGGLDTVLPAIARLAQRGGWLTLYLHDVGPDPSPWGATETMLTRALDAARAGGVEIRPYGEAFDRVTAGTAVAEGGATVAARRGRGVAEASATDETAGGAVTAPPAGVSAAGAPSVGVASVSVSVVIPTFRRPEGVLRAARSVFAQAEVAVPFELVIVDNCPDGSAREAIATLAAEATVPLRAVHEPEPGVANARNAGWRTATAPVIAFLDDDEEAHPGWLAGLLDIRARLDTPVVFGAVEAVVPVTDPAQAAFLTHFYSRRGPAEAGIVDHPFGAGSSLVDRAAIGVLAPPFDRAANDAGGEDDVFFDALRRRGVRFGWAPGAIAYEHVPPHRTETDYVVRRAFAWGQGPSQTCWERRPRDLLGVGYWMLVGAGQVLTFGPLAAVMWLTRASGRERMLDRAVQGLGKVFWMRGFRPLLYGRAQIAREAGGRNARPQGNEALEGARGGPSALRWRDTEFPAAERRADVR